MSKPRRNDGPDRAARLCNRCNAAISVHPCPECGCPEYRLVGGLVPIDGWMRKHADKQDAAGQALLGGK